MPVIKPRTRGKEILRHIARLDRENLEVLYAYAEFLGEPTDYILNEIIERVLLRDKDFLAWRATHPGSYAPRSVAAGAAAVTRPATPVRRGVGRVTGAPLALDIEA